VPRFPRQYSKTEIYHIMLRGNERKDIFIDEEDKREMKEFIHYINKYEEKNFLEMKETIKSEIDEENVNEYINGYLKSRNLKKEDLKRREHTKQKEDLIQQLKKRSNLSKRKIAILTVKRTVPLTLVKSGIKIEKELPVLVGAGRILKGVRMGNEVQ